MNAGRFSVRPRRVVKLGGRVQQDAQLPAALAAYCRVDAADVCIVHGGGDEITRLQQQLGRDAVFVGGRRVTSRNDVELVRMALSGTCNKRLVSALLSHDVNAVGISGEDGALLEAAVVDPALGCVGQVTRVNTQALEVLLAGGFVPVVSPLARDIGGGYGDALNVNGDDAAAAIAVALDAEEILFLADVPGVLVDGAVLASLDEEPARALIAGGVAAGGMAAKLEAAMTALTAGVPSARIGGLDALRDASAGTRITHPSLAA